jgi:hypothetical protein
MKGGELTIRDAESSVQRPTMRFVATKNTEQLDLQALHCVFGRLGIAFTIITLMFWQMGIDGTAKAAVTAAPPKYNAVTSKPFWWLELSLHIYQSAGWSQFGKALCRGSQASSSEKINIEVIVDFKKNTITGLAPGDSLVKIDKIEINQTTISFSGSREREVFVNGTIDRATGAANSITLDTKGKTILLLLYDLQCKPTQRMF